MLATLVVAGIVAVAAVFVCFDVVVVVLGIAVLGPTRATSPSPPRRKGERKNPGGNFIQKHQYRPVTRKERVAAPILPHGAPIRFEPSRFYFG